MKKAFSFIFFILFFLNASAQNYFIHGNVVDNQTGEPLAFANIRVEGTTFGTSANKDGKFELKLKRNSYKLIASFIGYISDTISVDLNTNISGINFRLDKTSINLPEVTVLPGKNPALAIIEKAIEEKNKRNKKLLSYEYEAYTKGIIRTQNDIQAGKNSIGIGVGVNDTAKLKINGILENVSKGYFEKPNKHKEIILARKQTANFPPSINILTGGRLIQNFYENDINFLGTDLPGPLSDDALNYYDYFLQKTLAINDKTVYQIYISPLDKADPGFVGDIYITSPDYALIKVDLNLNRAANVGGIFDTINVFQQFSMFRDSIYMPVDYHLFADANYLNIARFGFELSTILYDYKINPKLKNDIFNKAIITVVPKADEKDSTFWKNTTTIPNTQEETKAYKRIDSLENVPQTFWDRFSWLSTRINFSDKFAVSAPLAMYHFNSVEGSALDYGLFLDDAFKERLNSSLQLSYGFSDKKFKTDFHTDYLLGDYRTYKLSLNAFNKINVLFGSSENYNELTATVLALVSKYEFRDYYYSKGFNFEASGEVFPVLNLSAGFSNHTDNNAYNNTEFSLFAKNKKFRVNPQIYETRINAVNFGFKLDFRDYIEDGLYRRRTSLGKSYVIFEGNVENSSKEFLKSGIDYTSYELKTRGHLNTFRSSSLNFRIFGKYSTGKIPYQMLYAIPGNIDYLMQNYTFRTLNVNEMLGDRVLTLNLEHNWSDELFRFLDVPGLKNWEIQLNTFFNAAYTDFSSGTKLISPVKLNEFKHPFYEIGFGLGQVLIPLQIEFAWKLNYRGHNNFRIGINTFIY